MDKPAIILVPGAWHLTDHYEGLNKRLQAYGYVVNAVNLPSTVPKDGTYPEDLQPDIDVIRNAALAELEHSNVLFVMHSYGGFPGSSAAEGLDAKTRAAQGHKTYVQGMVYICAFMTAAGTSLLDGVGGKPAPIHDITSDGLVNVSGDPKWWFYHDCPAGEADRAVSMLRSQAWAVSLCPGRYTAYKDIPTSYLLCEHDRALPVAAQKSFVDAARAAGSKIHAEQLASGHSPFLSKPKETVDFIRRVAGEDIPSTLQTY